MHLTISPTSQACKNVSILKEISWWAAVNKVKARWLILFLYLPIIGLAIVLNEQLNAQGVQMPIWSVLPTAAVALMAVIVYPRRQSHAGRDRYIHRKLSQMLLSAATFCTIVWMFNSTVLSNGQFATPAYGSMRYSLEKPIAEPRNAVISAASSNGGRLLQKIEHLRHWYSEQPEWVQVTLTVLTCVLALILFVALAAVSCILVCEGYAFIGVALFVLGTVGIVFGAIALVRKIWGSERHGRKRYR